LRSSEKVRIDDDNIGSVLGNEIVWSVEDGMLEGAQRVIQHLSNLLSVIEAQNILGDLLNTIWWCLSNTQ
jgi:hypothetical protein